MNNSESLGSADQPAPTTSATNLAPEWGPEKKAKMEMEKDKPNRTPRKRAKGFLKSVVQKIESCLLSPQHRRSVWLKEAICKDNEGYVVIRALVERIIGDDAIRIQQALNSKGFLPLLRQSELLEVDAMGQRVRAGRAESSSSECILYIDNLPGAADDAWLRRAFSHFGRLIDAWVIKPRNKAAVEARKREEDQRKNGDAKCTPNCHRKNKGFGFVQFAHSSVAENVLSVFHGQNRTVECGKPKIEESMDAQKCVAASNGGEITTGCSGKRKLSNGSSQESLPKKTRIEQHRIDNIPLFGPCNGPGKDEEPPSSLVQGSEDIKPGKKRKRRTGRKNRRGRSSGGDAADRRWSTTLRVYTWAEWQQRKRSYLTKQRENFSQAKAVLKEYTKNKAIGRVLLKSNDRYRANGKELRGKEKLLLKLEAVQKRQEQCATVEDSNESVPREGR